MAASNDPSSATSDQQKSSGSGAPRWVKAWVPQDIKVTGGKCSLFRWIREDKLEAIMQEQEKVKETETKEQEATREILYLCSHEGCGRTFADPESIRKHAQIHKAGKQYICPYKDCDAKFSDNSKLERHMYVHTKIRNHICDHEGCGKAFSFQFNLNSHKKTHCDENYHYCPFDGCKKRFTEEYKLTNHINSCHQKNDAKVMRKHQSKAGSAAKKDDSSPDRPYSCPHTGCNKDYLHEYKLRLHLEKKHQLECNVSDLNADTIKDGSSKKSKKRRLDSTCGTIIKKPVDRRATLDLQTSDANNKFRIQRKDEDECKEVEEQKEHEGVVEGEDGYDSEETVDDDRWSNYPVFPKEAKRSYSVK